MTTLTAVQLVDFYRSFTKRSDIFKTSWHKIWNWKGLYSLEPIGKKVQGLIYPSNPRGVEAVACCVSIKDSDYKKAYFSNKNTPFEEWMGYVMASATIPFMMEPTHPGEWFDGGIREYVPIRESVRNCEKVISIATAPLLAQTKKEFKYKWPLQAPLRLYRTIDGAMQQEIKLNDYLKACEKSNVFVIEPVNELNVGMFEVSKETMTRLIDLGYERTMSQKKELLAFVA